MTVTWCETFIGSIVVREMVVRGACVLCSLKPDGQTDHTSLHGSCPTTKGEKWSATKWMHTGSFGHSAALQRAKWLAHLLWPF